MTTLNVSLDVDALVDLVKSRIEAETTARAKIRGKKNAVFVGIADIAEMCSYSTGQSVYTLVKQPGFPDPAPLFEGAQNRWVRKDVEDFLMDKFHQQSKDALDAFSARRRAR